MNLIVVLSSLGFNFTGLSPRVFMIGPGQSSMSITGQETLLIFFVLDTP